MTSFERAIEVGADVLETDVHMTRDGVVVVSHDEDGGRAAGVQRRIGESTLAEVKRWDAGRGFRDARGAPFAGLGLSVPTLEEVLEAFPQASFNIDIKQQIPTMVDAFLSIVRNHRAEERITVASFFTTVIRAVRAQFGGATVLAQREVIRLIMTPLSLLERRGVDGTTVQVPTRAGPFDLASRRFIEKCHRLGLRVDFWTVNDVTEADVLLHRGADGVITDDPARLAKLFGHYRSANPS